MFVSFNLIEILISWNFFTLTKQLSSAKTAKGGMVAVKIGFNLLFRKKTRNHYLRHFRELKILQHLQNCDNVFFFSSSFFFFIFLQIISRCYNSLTYSHRRALINLQPLRLPLNMQTLTCINTSAILQIISLTTKISSRESSSKFWSLIFFQKKNKNLSNYQYSWKKIVLKFLKGGKSNSRCRNLS